MVFGQGCPQKLEGRLFPEEEERAEKYSQLNWWFTSNIFTIQNYLVVSLQTAQL